MPKRRYPVAKFAAWAIGLIVIVSPVLFVSREEPVDVTAMRITRGHVEQTVTAIASGSVVPRLDAMVASELMGTVVELPYEEGERVEEGAILVALNHADLDARVALAEANLRVGTSRLEQTRLAAKIYEEVTAARVSQTQAQLELARVDFDRIKSLSEKRAVSQSDLDKTELALRVAQETYSTALANQRENLVRQEEVRSAESGMEQLEAALTVARATRDKAFVRAPFAGIVAKVLPEVGEAVAMGMPLVQLVQERDCYVEAPFDEANAAEIQVGQKARINIDAYRGVDFPGEVTFISPVVHLNADLSRTLTLKLRILEGAEKFTPGMSADVTVLVDEKEGALFVPSESLIRQRFVYIIRGGRAVRTEVVPGVGNWNTREITAGLNEGDSIVTSVSLKELKDGVKVKVVDDLELR